MKSVIELHEVSISKSNQKDQSRTAWSLYLKKQISVSLLQWHSQCNDLLILITLLINELILLLIHMQLVSLLQRHLSSTWCFISLHRFILQWINLFIDSYATSESASMINLSSMQWSTYSHCSIYQWIFLHLNLYAISYSASTTSLSCIVSLLQ